MGVDAADREVYGFGEETVGLSPKPENFDDLFTVLLNVEYERDGDEYERLEEYDREDEKEDREDDALFHPACASCRGTIDSAVPEINAAAI